MTRSDDLQGTFRVAFKQQALFDVVVDEDNPYSVMLHPADTLFSHPLVPQLEYTRPYSPLRVPTIPMNNRQISIFSFFSGAGFLDLGFEYDDFKIAYVNEVHRPFLDAYHYARENLQFTSPEYGHYEGSIADFIDGDKNRELGEMVQDARRTSTIVGFLGGPPCPDFSIGGKNRGKDGNNGKLSGMYVELICRQKPDFYLFENVKGLWSTKRHRAFFEDIKRKTQLAGYVTTERLMNAIECGAPQDRDRVILLGFRRELLSDLGFNFSNDVLEIPDGIFPWESFIRHPKEEAFAYQWPTTQPFEEDSELPCGHDVDEELTVEHWFKKNDVLNHPNAEHYFKPRAGITRFASVAEGDDSKKSFKRLHRWRYSPTACYGNNEVHLHPYKIRRISVAEAMAIQSLPKDFVLPPSMTLTNMFKTVGNGVPFIMANTLAKTISSFLKGNRHDDKDYCL